MVTVEKIQHSGKLWDRYIYLIDDGFEGGTSCADYWTTLFEAYAGLCIKKCQNECPRNGGICSQYLIMQSDQLEEIDKLNLPFPGF